MVLTSLQGFIDHYYADVLLLPAYGINLSCFEVAQPIITSNGVSVQHHYTCLRHIIS